MQGIPMKVDIKRVENNPDLFDFIVATPVIKTQFCLPRNVVNQLRILIEKELVKEQ